MTRKNEPSYRKKGLSVFLTVLMVLSVVAMSAAFVGTVAAQNTTDDIEHEDIGVGVDSTAQDIESPFNMGIAENDEEVAIQVNISSLLDAGVNISEIDGSVTFDTSDTETVEDVDTERALINLTVDATGDNFDVTQLEIDEINTSGVNATEDLTYTWYVLDGQGNDAAGAFDDPHGDFQDDATAFETEGFDLVAQAITIDDMEISTPVERTLVNDTSDFQDVSNDFTQTIDLTGVEIGADTEGTVVFDFSEMQAYGANATDARVSNDGAFDSSDAEFNATTGEFTFNLTNTDSQIVTDTVEIELDVVGEDIEANTDVVVDHVANGADTSMRLIHRGTQVADYTQSITSSEIWEGETISAEASSAGDTVEIWNESGVDPTSPGDAEIILQKGTSPGEVRNIDTSELGEGEYTISFDEDGGTQSDFEILPLDLAVSSDDVQDNEDLIAEVTSEDIFGDNSIEFNLIDEDGETVDTITRDLDGDGEATANFGEVDAGEYDVEATHSASQVTASDNVTVTEFEPEPVPDLDAEFGDIEDQNEGDIMEIPIELTAAEGEEQEVNIVISEDDFEATLNITLAEDYDGDGFTLSWNLYEAGKHHMGVDQEDIIWSDDDANVSIDLNEDTEIQENFRLNPAGYTFALYEEADFDNRVDSASATVLDRHTGDTTIHIAPSDIDVDDLDALLGNATESNEVANGDVLIVEQEVSGIFGAGTNATTQTLPVGVNFTGEQVEAPAYAEADSWNHSTADAMHADAANNTVYFVIQVDEEELDEGDEIEYETEFEVSDYNDYVDEDEDEVAENEYTVVERALELDLVEEPYQVTPTEDAVITGTSTLAPGSNVTVTVDVPGITFDVDDTIQVDEDGNWTYAEDYSDREVGEEFEITIEAHDVDAQTFDGVFDDVPEADTTTDADDMRDILDDVKDALGVDDDGDIVDAIEDLQDDLAQAEDDLAQAEDDLAQAEDDLAQAEDDLAQAEDDLADAQAEAQQWMTAYEEAQDEIADLEDDVADRDDTIADLEGDVSDRDDTIDDLNDEISDLEDEIADLEDQIDADDDQPAFGPIAALIAILAGGALVARRRLN